MLNLYRFAITKEYLLHISLLSIDEHSGYMVLKEERAKAGAKLPKVD